MAQLTLKRLSYSTLNKLDACPSKLYLGKGTAFKQTPGWAGVGGRAAHALIEGYDHYLSGGDRRDPDEYDWTGIAHTFLGMEIASETEASGFEPDKWRASKGGAEGRAWWERKLPEFGRLYADWRQANPQFVDWVSPDGEFGAELEIKVNIPGVKLPFLAFIDKIMVDTSRGGALVIVDYKSGSMLPDDLTQFFAYASLVEIRYGIRPAYAGIYNVRKGELAPLRKGGATILPLHHVPTDVWIKGVQERERIIDLDVWPARPSKACAWCEVRDACVYGGGSQAMTYDPHHPLYRGDLGLAA